MIAPPPIPVPITRVPADRPDTFVWRCALAVAGLLLGLLGAATLLAWGSGNIEFVQFDSEFQPFHYNAGIGMLAWGAGFLALASGRHRLARFAGALLAAYALLLLGAQFSDSGLGLDRWLFPPLNPTAVPREGAPRPLVGGLLLGATAILLAARTRTTPLHAIFGSLIGLILLVGGITSLFATRAGLFTMQCPGISLPGVAASAIAGSALLASMMRKRIPSIAVGHTLPLSVALAGVAVTFTLWVGLNSEQNRRLQRQVQFEADHLHRIVEDRLNDEFAELSELSERWPRTDLERIKGDASSYVGLNPGCVGVARVEPNRSVTWAELRHPGPPRNSLSAIGGAEHFETAIHENRAVAIRPPRSQWQGTRMLVLFVPDRQPAPDTGGLIVVFRLQEFFDAALNANVAPGYAIALADDREQVFGRNTKDGEYRKRWAQVLPVQFHSLQWQLSVWPTHDVLERESLSLPKLALGIGLLTTALLALAVYLAQTARRRTADLEKEVREREQTQQALRRSEEKYRSLIENLGQGVFLQDRDLRYVAANGTFCRSLDRTEPDVIGRTDAELFAPALAERRAAEAASVLASGNTVECEEDREVAGRRIHLRRVLSPMRDADGAVTGVLGICWDVTEQRQLESHLHQASKMDAIGQLAGGIAHDFNNLLTAILGNIDLILGDDATRASTRELAGAAHSAATRAASLTQRLLGFSRRHNLDWVETDLNAIAQEVVALLRRTIDPLVRIETRLHADLWSVLADPVQMNQVLMNLCLNARDAMPRGGRILIETACVPPADLPPNRLADRSGDFVRLRVSDSGEGMSDEVKSRIYEPFFTTKGVGNGTGLGLAMVFAIVRHHKGWIDCTSEIGCGTTFEIYLPRGAGAAACDETGPLTPVVKRAGRETILVVDDEDMIRRIAAMTLKSRGYTVFEAADGQEALDVYAREEGRIDLILLDLTMPVLSGHETFRQLLQINPRVKVVFASGYAEEQLTEQDKEQMTGFLKKPYRPNDLTAAIQEALQRHAPDLARPRSRGSRGLLLAASR
jgi:PAS domain S-box-containing protein